MMCTTFLFDRHSDPYPECFTINVTSVNEYQCNYSLSKRGCYFPVSLEEGCDSAATQEDNCRSPKQEFLANMLIMHRALVCFVHYFFFFFFCISEAFTFTQGCECLY